MEAFIEGLFCSVLNMSITASVVIAAVMLLRLPLRKASGAVSYGLWFVVLFRLLCPVSLKSAVSIFGLLGSNTAMKHIPTDIGTMVQPQVNVIVPGVTSAINDVLPAATPTASVNPMQIILFVLATIWVLGVIILLAYSLVLYLLLKRKIYAATLIHNNIYQTDRISSPFVCGFFRPRIILPLALGFGERGYIIRHEETHIKRRDYLVKPLWFLAVCIHWFNPFAWLSFHLVSRDMEMRCDEAVIREMGENIKADYSSSLLTLAKVHKFLPGSPLAFGETGIKMRVRNVLNYKRPAFWVIAVAVVAVISATVVLAVNPKETKTGQSLAEQFLQYKTDYVGNNSKVGGIISLLEFPENVSRDSFELKTDAEPYAVTIKLNAGPSLKAYYSDTSRQQQFKNNAAVMLSLIGNVETINFKLSDGSDDSSPLELVYTRDWSDTQYGQDVRLFTRNREEFEKLLYAQAIQPVQSNISAVVSSASADHTVLDACVGNAILSENANLYPKSDFAAESHVTLKTVENGNMTTVYTMALYQEYEYSGGGLSNTGGSHMPVAITFAKNTAGQYTLIEYWIPKDGSYYAPSIKEKFPADIYKDALDTQKYIMAQEQACYEQAIANGKVDANAVIKKLLETIASSPAQASNPGAYIEAHPIEYRELLYYGQHTLQYCFSLFEQGGQTDLNGQIMAAACRSILGDEDIQLLADTGQKWYDAFKSNAENLRNKNGDDYMKKHMPRSYLLLQTLESTNK
ncbi:M56 family metallopeptidase [Desulfosporosinus sp. PR]|uniref:M56 family metallopeptidase n=1 Tax=Candidatus Desulfosporosinus nitrosoreducens TaxID=3401928 RepID=UPI0027EEA45A|nr:M56 family metallopeptidase [Desulfosporosinus sp. PR]MDQ7096595.1 M56 family metallopeptidase [Desulfosporosinus sp. PR]